MGGASNMGGIMSQVKKMQEEMEKAQAALADEQVTATAGGGMVSVVATGKQQIVSITIQREAVDPEDVDMLQDLVLAAVNEALDKSRDLEQERMGALTGGLNLPPGLF
jgi:hypothetical protein